MAFVDGFPVRIIQRTDVYHPEWTYNSKVIYAFVTYFLLSITYTAINIPYCSLGSVITNDPKNASPASHIALCW
jgi:Na+/melibiose symporter-like transporter